MKAKKKAETVLPPEPMVTLTLTVKQVELLKEGLDSHRYWQLADEQYRNSGFVMEPGSDDEDQAAQITECDALEHELDRAIDAVVPPKPETPSPEYLASIGTPKRRTRRQAGGR